MYLFEHLYKQEDTVVKKRIAIHKTKTTHRDFPGGTMDRNLPAQAGDMSSIPGPRALKPMHHNH